MPCDVNWTHLCSSNLCVSLRLHQTWFIRSIVIVNEKQLSSVNLAVHFIRHAEMKGHLNSDGVNCLALTVSVNWTIQFWETRVSKEHWTTTWAEKNTLFNYYKYFVNEVRKWMQCCIHYCCFSRQIPSNYSIAVSKMLQSMCTYSQ